MDLSIILELQHFNAIIRSFQCYQKSQNRKFIRKYNDWSVLPNYQKNVVFNIQQKFKHLFFCIAKNQAFMMKCISDRALNGLLNAQSFSQLLPKYSRIIDFIKLNSTLRQCLRDWSLEGKLERWICYKPILNILKIFFPEPKRRKRIKILIPGSGLGRLAWEVASLGFQTQGNEFSYHMLIMSNFILNYTRKEREFEIYPHIDSTINVWRFRDQNGKSLIPDISPTGIKRSNKNFTMLAGDFLDMFLDDQYWNVVITCFFIDTGKNIMNYLDTLSIIIKKKGCWFNLGPLLYHFDEIDEVSIELTYEELRNVIPSFGFKFLEEKLGLSAVYANNQLSMLQMAYNTIFFVCEKIE